MPTEMELTLEQTQQGVSYEVSNIRVISFTMKMEILLELTSNKLMVEHAEYDESNTYVLERFDTTAGNPVKKILLKLNLSDHTSILTDSKEYLKMVMEPQSVKVKEFQERCIIKAFQDYQIKKGNDEMTELVMDSGGSYHMTHMRDFLYDFKVVDGGSVRLRDNRTYTIKGTGKVKIQLHDGSNFILEDVRYVPGLRRSLISLGTLEKEGYTMKMQMGRIKVTKGRRVMMTGTRKKNCVYTLEAKVMTFGVQNHGGSKQVGLKQLGSKQVGFKQLGHKQVGFKQLGPGVKTGVHRVQDVQRVWFEVELQGAQRDREAEVFQVSNDDTAVAQRRLEDKQLEEKTNTDCLVNEQEKIHLGIKVGANIMVTGVPGQEGAEGNVAEKKKVKESMEANLGKLLKYNAWSTRWSPVRDKVFTVNLHHDGIFICNPIKYVYGELKQISDIDFEGMSFNDFHDVVSHFVLGTVKRLYYCSIKSELKDGIKKLKTDKDVEDFLKGNVNETPFESSDEYESSDEVEEIDYVDFHTEGEENVVIKNLSTQDPFLNKLCSNQGSFSGFIDEPQLVDQEPIDDPDAASIDPLYKVKRGVSYPKHDPIIPWNEMKPILGMLRLVGVQECIATKKYVPKKKLFVDDSPRSENKSNTPKKAVAGKKAKPKKKQGPPVKKGRPVKKVIPVKKSVSFSPSITKKSVNSGEGCSKHGEGTSRDAEKSPQSPKWTKSKIIGDKKHGPVCGFRLWASWMTTERSFQIKSLHPEHKCSRNYKLGSLVTYKWIAHQFAKDIINDPFMPYIKLKDAIRQKFMIDVSIDQCKRAKQRALYDQKGGLIEHYGRL
ncbi:zinc finger, CCHC-type containing protein [Tanacetum coccineum]